MGEKKKYLFIANFELFPQKSVFWSHLFIGLTPWRASSIERRSAHDD